ncbi:MAG: HAD family hydrolase [candidate division KSB1 bacterium]|jgi:HAD superfamily hydrolase (TIGR01549 family)|nr:HAD family hydrolase [candidate division KSB1 bacterium]
MINWIFLDVGNVILNDDPAMTVLYKYIHAEINRNGGDVSFEDLLRDREKSILGERNGRHWESVAIHYLGVDKWKPVYRKIRKRLASEWGAISPLMAPIVPVIEELANSYQLGLIANQPREAEDILGSLGLMHYFKVNAISAIAGHSKPDPRIFTYALDKAGCAAEESIMIGDRIDNDVVPAKALGMKTIWLPLPLTLKGYQPKDDLEKMYFRSIESASASRMLPRNEAETPDYKADSFEAIIEGVRSIDIKTR